MYKCTSRTLEEISIGDAVKAYYVPHAGVSHFFACVSRRGAFLEDVITFQLDSWVAIRKVARTDASGFSAQVPR